MNTQLAIRYILERLWSADAQSGQTGDNSIRVFINDWYIDLEIKEVNRIV